MGSFVYDALLAINFDDRVLAHIQLVVGAKLRRGESFYFSWKSDADSGGGLTTIWIHPGLALAYRYPGSKMPLINRAWIEVLSASANSPGGLHLLPEPDGEAEANPVREILAHRDILSYRDTLSHH